MSKIAVPLSFSLYMTVLVSCNSQDRIKRWNSDLDFYINQVKTHHYVYKKEPLSTEFNAAAEKLRNNFSSYSDQRILLEFELLAATLGDGHTYVLPWAATTVPAYTLPLRFYAFSDGLFIIDAPEQMRNLIGRKVLSLGGIAAKDAMLKIAPYISRDNDEGVKWIGPTFLTLQGALEGIGAVIDNGNMVIEWEDTSKAGQKTSLMFELMKPTRGIPKLFPPKTSNQPTPLYLKNVSDNYWVKSIHKGKQKVVYFQFNQVMNKEEESLLAFSKRLSDTLKLSGARKLFVDVRHNNGGNAELLYPLLDVLTAFQKTNGPSSIAIITGRNTFSAAQIFISKCDRLFHPIFVGEASSSKPNFVGEENGVTLPYSGAMCSISNRYHESIPGDSRTFIEPDKVVLLSSADYFMNEDPVLNMLLSE
jgi:hypothetical protein